MSRFLVLPTLEDALSRSETKALEVGCDGVHTRYWWAAQELLDASVALEIQDNDLFGETGLSDQELNGLNSAAQMASLLPVLDHDVVVKPEQIEIEIAVAAEVR